MTRYRKKPVEVEAWQAGSDEKMPDWLFDAMEKEIAFERVDGTGWLIKTLEGDHFGNVGDYIIQGVQGELYPCKPDIFEQTYEVVDESHSKQLLTTPKHDPRAGWTCKPHLVARTLVGYKEPCFWQAVCDCGWIVGEDGTPNLSEFEHLDSYCGGCGAKVVRR